MSFFEKMEMAPVDPILGLSQAFLADSRRDKVNLGAGVYKTAELKPYILSCVKRAEEILLEEEVSKDYLPISGEKNFLEEAKKLIFGELNDERICAIQSVGGTGGLKIGGELLLKNGATRLFLSDPTWDNHRRLFKQAGFVVDSYAYYDWISCQLNFSEMCHSIGKLQAGDVIVLHCCCHNPTGLDPTMDQWKEICQLIKKRRVIPLFDLAYQGFGEGLEQDVGPIRHFIQEGLELLIAASYSKNFGLYAERVGVLNIVCHDKKTAKRVESQIKSIIRGIYSTPPCHGARIVATVLRDPTLRAEWQEELAAMRVRIEETRFAFLAALQARGLRQFGFIEKQKGMFSYTGLKQRHVDQLIAEYGIYLPIDGRINIAGLCSKNLDYVAEAIATVVK